ILNIGTDAAFRILEQALTSGTTRSRDAIMQSIGTVRDERSTPLFTYILGHVDHRGALAPIYLRAIESLGALRDPAGVASLRSAQLYSAGHPIIARNLESLSSAFQLLHSLQPLVVVGIVGDEVIVDDMPMARADTLGPLIRRLQQSGVERITVERGVTADELAAFIEAITTIEGRTAGPGDQPQEYPSIPHIRVGRVSVEQRVEGSLTDMATIKRLYEDAVTVAGDVWDSAATEGKPDAWTARRSCA